MKDIRTMSQFRLPQKTRDELAAIAQKLDGSMTDAVIDAVAARAVKLDQVQPLAESEKTVTPNIPALPAKGVYSHRNPANAVVPERKPIFGGMLKGPKADINPKTGFAHAYGENPNQGPSASGHQRG